MCSPTTHQVEQVVPKHLEGQNETPSTTWSQCTDRLKKPMLTGLIRAARFSARRPVTTVVACITTSFIVLVIGLLTNFYIENNGDILWTPTDCTTLYHGDWIASEASGFPQPAREVQVVVHANGENVLGLDGITKVFQVMDTIRQTPGYHELCALGRRSNSANPECPIHSATGFWEGHNSTLFHETTKNDEEAIEALSQLLYASNKEPVDRSIIFGQPLPAIPPTGMLLADVLSSSTHNNNTMILMESASAYMNLVGLPPVLDEALPFEAEVTKRLFRLRDEWAREKDPEKRFILEVMTFRSFDDELSRSIAEDIPLMGTAFVLMGAFCAFTLGKWNPTQSQSLLGVGGVSTILLSLMTGYGLMFCIGIPFTSLTQIFPYVMVGIGLDDTFIITGAFARTDPTKDIADRIEEVMHEVGISISVSTMTTFVAFMLGGVSSVPGMRWFAWYAGPTVAIDFIYQVTFFVAILALDDKRQKANRRDCCPCCLVRPDKIDEEEIEEVNAKKGQAVEDGRGDDDREPSSIPVPFTTKMIDAYSNVLLKPFSKGVVLLVFAAMVVMGAFAASKQTQEFDWRDLTPADSYVRDFIQSLDAYVGQRGNVLFLAACYFRDLDVSKKVNQDAMFSFVDEMVKLDYIQTEPPNFWLRDFLEYANQTEEVHNLNFYGQLDVFLSTEPYEKLYRNDIVRDDENFVTASRIYFVFDGVNPYDNEQQINALKGEQSVAARQPLNSNLEADDWKLFSHGGIYNVWELFDIIFYEIILTVGLGLLAVFLIALVFLPHPVGALIVTPVVAAIYIELLGLLYVADIYVNSISAVGLTMSIGLVVDYNMHIVLSYFEIQDEQIREKRVRKTLSTMGKSILLGGFSTFLGVLPLSMSSSEIFRTFFVTFIGIVLLGVGHGMIFTPVVLSLIAPDAPDVQPEGAVSTHSLRTTLSSFNSLHLVLPPGTAAKDIELSSSS